MRQRVKPWTRWGGSLSVSMTGSGTVVPGSSQSATGTAAHAAALSAAFAGSGTAYEAGAALVAGETATATGTGFGSTGPTYLAVGNFEDGSNGSPLGQPNVAGSWTIEEMTYSSSNPHSGTMCALSSPDGDNQFRNMHIYLGLDSSEKMYFSAWMRIDGDLAPTEAQDGQRKLCQIHGDPYVGNYAPGMGWGSSGYWKTCSVYREDSDYVQGGDSQTIDHINITGNTWQHVELVVQMNSAGQATDGYIRLYADGVLDWFFDGNNRRDTSRKWGTLAWCDGHTNAPGYFCDYYTDEVYCQKGWSRVVLSNNATLANATLWVPQYVTNWSSTAVQYTVFAGALSSGTVYEHVIDDDNTVVQTTERTLA